MVFSIMRQQIPMYLSICWSPWTRYVTASERASGLSAGVKNQGNQEVGQGQTSYAGNIMKPLRLSFKIESAIRWDAIIWYVEAWLTVSWNGVFGWWAGRADSSSWWRGLVVLVFLENAGHHDFALEHLHWREWVPTVVSKVPMLNWERSKQSKLLF